MKANRHDDTIFSVCVLYAAHGIFITKDFNNLNNKVYVYKLCGIIKHTKSACLTQNQL